MVLAPHAGAWQDAGVVHLAEELTAPMPVLHQEIHQGTRAQSASFPSMDVPYIVEASCGREHPQRRRLGRTIAAGGRTAATNGKGGCVPG
jgi:hypothetical protein